VSPDDGSLRPVCGLLADYLRTICGLTRINAARSSIATAKRALDLAEAGRFAPFSIEPVTQSETTERPSQVLATHREEVLDLARARGASNVRVFGSVARGEDTQSSDIDLLADFPLGTSLLTVIGLEQVLRELLGVSVDLGPADSLRADMRARVLAEARPL
jgi:predicted nucleotidyltransferase